MELTEAVSPHVYLPVIGVVFCAFLVFAFGFRSPVQPPSFDFEDDKKQKRGRKSKVKSSSNGHIAVGISEQEIPRTNLKSAKQTTVNKTKLQEKLPPSPKSVEKIKGKKPLEKEPAVPVKPKRDAEDNVKNGEWTMQVSRKGKKQRGKKDDRSDGSSDERSQTEDKRTPDRTSRREKNMSVEKTEKPRAVEKSQIKKPNSAEPVILQTESEVSSNKQLTKKKKKIKNKELTDEEFEKSISASQVKEEKSVKSNKIKEALPEKSVKSNKIKEALPEKSKKANQIKEPISGKSAKASPNKEPISEKSTKASPNKEPISEKSKKGSQNKEPISEKSTKASKIKEPVSEKSTKGSKIKEPLSEKSAKGSKIKEPLSEKSPKGSPIKEALPDKSMKGNKNNKALPQAKESVSASKVKSPISEVNTKPVKSKSEPSPSIPKIEITETSSSKKKSKSKKEKKEEKINSSVKALDFNAEWSPPEVPEIVIKAPVVAPKTNKSPKKKNKNMPPQVGDNKSNAVSDSNTQNKPSTDSLSLSNKKEDLNIQKIGGDKTEPAASSVDSAKPPVSFDEMGDSWKEAPPKKSKKKARREN